MIPRDQNGVSWIKHPYKLIYRIQVSIEYVSFLITATRRRLYCGVDDYRQSLLTTFSQLHINGGQPRRSREPDRERFIEETSQDYNHNNAASHFGQACAISTGPR